MLLLDVDGPLNPHLAGPLDGWRVVRGGWGVWRINDEHGAWLRELADTYDLVWATAWEDQANEHIAPALGLPPLPVIRFPEVGTGRTWKLTAVRAYVGRRAVCWVDDELHADAERWAQRRRQPTMLVRADPRTGLTATDRDRITDWAILQR